MEKAVVSFAIQTIAGLLIDEAKFLVGVKDQVEQLQTELGHVKWFLEDADARKDDKDRTRKWVSEVKDIAYQAGDLLESYAFRVGSRRGGGLMKALNRCVCILNECYLQHQLRSEIESLNRKIQNLKESLRTYGIREIIEKEGSSSTQQELRRTYSFVDEEDFVGLESDVDKLVQHLVNEDDKHGYFRVVSISGMGGLGKTTIASKVYNHPNVKRHFDGFAWICVSQQWQTTDLLVRMLIKLVPQRREEIEKWREDELKKELKNVLQQKKCLIVLDDIWGTDAWDCIKQGFPTREKGSKILLTTRNREVALHIGPNGFHHEPRLLNENESWELLQRKAPRERYAEEHEDINQMEQLGKEMVQQCGGLPLALVVLGGILATKHTLSEWKAVHQNIKAILGKGESIAQHQGEVHKILALSYNDLPYQLKPCFLYLSYFSEDTDIKAETLYQMWIAEGMVLMKDRLGEEESMMDLAERYLRALAERGMVMVKTAKMPTVRKFESCRLHDLMWDMCLRKAEEESFLSIVNYSSRREDHDRNDHSDPFTTSSSNHKTLRLVINLEGEDVCRYAPPRKEMAKRLRMFGFVVLEGDEGCMAKTIESQFKSFKVLRVLSIEGLTGDDRWKLPEALGELIHLRYLGLKDSRFWTLPSSLGNLKHLQTLDLQDTTIGGLPNVLWKMAGLRYLYLPDFDEALTGSHLGKRPNFRIAGEFSKLEILENFDSRWCEATDLRYLTNLRVLTVTRCGDLENLAVIANYISSSNSLQHVSIVAYCGFRSNLGLTVLKQLLFGRNIHRLLLRNSRGIAKLPEWEASCDTSALVELELWPDPCDEDPMRILEKLPHLRKLKIWWVGGKEMTWHATGFPQLRDLTIYSSSLEKWEVEKGAMPNLSILRLSNMPSLQMIPDGLQFISTLKELYLEHMPEEFIERRIRRRSSDGEEEEGEDFYKIRHVPLLVIRRTRD